MNTVIEVIYQAKMSNYVWSQLCKCEDVLIFPALYDYKCYIWGFWTVGRRKQAQVFHNLRTFY